MSDTIALKITQASLNQTALDWPQNMANHYSAIDIAVAEGSDMVLMPELSITGYEVNDDFQRTDNNRMFEALSSIAAYAQAKDPHLIVSVGLPWRLQLRQAFKNTAADPDIVKNALYDRLHLPFNVQTLICGGKIVSMTAKANLFNDKRGYEGRYFNEWSFRDAKQVASLLGVNYKYGTLPIELPNGAHIPFGTPLVYITDKRGNAYIHGQVICESKWAATKYDGYPYDDSRYAHLNIIPSIARFLGTKDGVLLEIPNASPPSRLKQDKHMHLNELASKYADVVVDTDGLGTSGGTFAQYGHRLIAQNGKTIAADARLKFGHLATTTSIVRISNAAPKLNPKTHTGLVRDFIAPSAAPKVTLVWQDKKGDDAWDDPENLDRWKEEAIRRNALWKFDYIRKAGSKGLANALSGGQDSGFNAVQSYVGVSLGMHQMGVEGFCDYMNVPFKEQVLEAARTGGRKAAIKTFMDHFLITYYMPTENSSKETLKAARALIEGGVDEKGNAYEGIGGQFVVRHVQDLVTMCTMVFGIENTSTLSTARKQKIMLELSDFVHASPEEYSEEDMNDWAARLQKDYPEIKDLTSAAMPGHNIAYQNFQARVRTVLIWAAANVHKRMPEANPNLDEAYGAYATSAGDLHGGSINPNAGYYKADEQALLKYLEEKGLQGVIAPIKALNLINNNRPTAELNPKGKDGKIIQFDEDELQGTFPQKKALARLMHHTKVITEHGERELNAGEIFKGARINDEFARLDDNQLFNVVAYFYERWRPAQHKIHFSPIAETTGNNVDKQTSRRSPNLNGGRRDEIVQLGIDLLFKWARADELEWDQKTYDVLNLRAWQDKVFVEKFYDAIRNKDKTLKNMSYNLRGLYEQLKKDNWDTVFGPDDAFPSLIYIAHHPL
jgi:NH3-dependent NAD+ synthetase